jgi:transposase
MDTFDGRKIGPKAMEHIRVRAVKRVQQGESPEKIIATLGFSRACIYNWLAKYRAGGWDSLKSGKQTGRPKKLSGSQIAWIDKTIREKDPLQLKFSFALWTRSMVTSLIRKKFGLKLSESSVGRLLRQMGFSCQRPLYRAYQQDSEAVEHWKKQVFPQIKKRAKKLRATIFFEDESGIRSDFHAGTTWAPKGKTPTIKVTGSRFSTNMIAAISTRGNLRFMVHQGSISANVICDFLNRLMYNAQNPIFLIWDGHPTHKSKKVRECINSFEGKLEVYLLPSYSPELNPTEQVWRSVKNHTVGRKAVFGPDQLKSAVIGSLRRLQKISKIIMAFFQHPECRYILCNV